ncbi:MAG: hypothetical protein ACXVX8_17630 [Blastococcus sp.]
MPPTPARETFAHDAVLTMAADGDERAPGGAITVALCGSWTHDPPCPLAPHHTSAERIGDEVVLRVLFAAAPQDEPRVRRLLDEALVSGSADGPDDTRTSWRLVRSAASAVREDERDHAQRLTRS